MQDPPACVTVNVWPPAVIVPVREVDGFAATVKAIVAPPVPLAPAVIVIQDTLLTAVHEQLTPVFIEKIPEPPPAATDCPADPRVYVQVDVLWVTVNVCPPAVIVPVRDEVELAAMVKAIDPEPDPLAPDVIVIQAALLTAVQPQPVVVVMATEPVPPPTGKDCPVDPRANVQAGADCVTVNVWPPAVIVPVREEVVEFAATVKAIDADPDPLAPDVTVIHVALLTAVQVQPVAAVMVTEPVPPAAATDSPDDPRAKVQDAAAWVTVKVWPPVVIVPVREAVVGFAATLKAIVPEPDPLAPDVIVIQAALLVAVHVQPARAVMVTEPRPPAAATDRPVEPRAYVQDVAACVTVNV